VCLDPRYANRHGLIAGATGTGKTVTLQVMAESFSRMGVPVFVSDVKGDLSGISQPGSPHAKIDERVQKIGITDFQFAAAPTVFWDLFGVQGHPIRATISDMGPLLLARLLDLNDTQEGVLTVAFEFADDEGLLLLDMDDLRTTLQYVGDNAKSFAREYGNVSRQSIGAILRRLLVIQREGGEQFFGEPALDLHDMIRIRPDGRGQVNVLAADQLMSSPRIYSTFLLWLLSELFEELPEIGDPDKPRFVFFFDEAHLLFNRAPKALLEKVEQVVRLIRSKGVGVYFVTQNPLDIPETVLGQLGNRVQHALRAFTPKDQKAVRAAAQTFRANPALDTATVITELGVGAITPGERRTVVNNSPLAGRYDTAVDRESAHELLRARAEKAAKQARARDAEEGAGSGKKPGRRRQSIGEAFIKSLARTVGNQIGRQLMRGILGSMKR
jgi:DNA helicase HerA-like ATPase